MSNNKPRKTMKTFKVTSITYNKSFTVQCLTPDRARYQISKDKNIPYAELSAVRVKAKGEKSFPKKAVIFVSGKRWFDKVNGNTYHSVRVWVNGDFIGGESFTYGYGDHYQQTAFEILDNAFYFEPSKFHRGIYTLQESHGAKVVVTCADVASKKNL